MVQNLSFSRNERIQKSSEFQKVYKGGRKLVTKYFVIFFSDDEERRLGITVTKAIGTAVRRNAIKRQVREVFRRVKSELPKGSAVVKARLSAKDAESSEIRIDLLTGFRRLAKKEVGF